LNSCKDYTKNKFPLGLNSPSYFRGENRRSWSLISFGLQFEPEWTFEATKSKRRLCLYREITYLSSSGQVEGLGRSWVPFTLQGIKLLMITFNPRNPKPLGVAIESLIGDDLSIEVISKISCERVLNPYRLSVETISSYKRAMKRISTNIYFAFTEEDIVETYQKQEE
jgi:hypothetical protein